MKLLYKNTAQVQEDELFNIGNRLKLYIEHLQYITAKEKYDYNESSINLPFDEQIIKDVVTLKNKLVSNKLKYIIVVGIGGANLGSKAVYEASHGYYDALEPNRFPKILYIDNINERYLAKLKAFLDQNTKSHEEFLINVISKSGTTMETTLNLNYILKNIPGASERLVVTTDYENDMWRKYRAEGANCLAIPKIVGDRYLVFSAEGLFPLACAGLDILELIQGAMQMRKACLTLQVAENPAALSAVIFYLNSLRGRKISDNFFFNSELESLGKWYRQLLAESIGKSKLGITPQVSIGTTDLHSQIQLNIAGPKDKFTTFIWSEEAEPEKLAILAGVKDSYITNELPFNELVFNNLSLRSLGEFMQFKMIEIMFLANLLNINAFDQPDVEEYKQEAMKHLKHV